MCNATSESYFPVQIPIELFSIIQPPPLAFGEMGQFKFKMQNGSHIDITFEFSGIAGQDFSFDEQSLVGSVLINGSLVPSVGTYNLTVSVVNLVTPIQVDRASVNVDYKYENINIYEHLFLNINIYL